MTQAMVIAPMEAVKACGGFQPNSSNENTRTGFVTHEGGGLESGAPILLLDTLNAALEDWAFYPWDES
jgi:hypothetical protein